MQEITIPLSSIVVSLDSQPDLVSMGDEERIAALKDAYAFLPDGFGVRVENQLAHISVNLPPPDAKTAKLYRRAL